MAILRRTFLGALTAATALAQTNPRITLWYGKRQRFGERGLPQRWINILGDVQPAAQIAELAYSLNGGEWRPLSTGPDLRRLAAPGDFNIEIDPALLKPGENEVRIRAASGDGTRAEETVAVEYAPGGQWPLPYLVDLTNVEDLQKVCQVVDGRWELTAEGARPAVWYYDRVLAFGDMNWTNYAMAAEVQFHDFPGPGGAGPGFGVNHAGIGLRWRGHAEDGKQPRVQWYPLGAATEFTLQKDLAECRWRILPGPPQKAAYAENAFPIELNKKYWLKGEVVTLANGRNRYRNKIWPANAPEPDAWAVENIEQPADDFPSGSALFVAHRSDVTLSRIAIEPI